MRVARVVLTVLVWGIMIIVAGFVIGVGVACSGC